MIVQYCTHMHIQASVPVVFLLFVIQRSWIHPQRCNAMPINMHNCLCKLPYIQTHSEFIASLAFWQNNNTTKQRIYYGAKYITFNHLSPRLGAVGYRGCWSSHALEQGSVTFFQLRERWSRDPHYILYMLLLRIKPFHRFHNFIDLTFIDFSLHLTPSLIT